MDEPAAIIFSQNGKIRYSKSNQYFPRLSVHSGQPVPSNSVSSLSKADIGEVSDAIEVDPAMWVSNVQGVALFEQTLAQRNGFRMTLLTAEIEEIEAPWSVPIF